MKATKRRAPEPEHGWLGWLPWRPVAAVASVTVPIVVGWYTPAVLTAAVVLAAYGWMCARHPWRDCWRCRGTGGLLRLWRYLLTGKRAHKRHRRCQGTGKAIRRGRVLWVKAGLVRRAAR